LRPLLAPLAPNCADSYLLSSVSCSALYSIIYVLLAAPIIAANSSGWILVNWYLSLFRWDASLLFC